MAIVINGSGTVTGLAVGGLPDGTVDEGTLATDSVTTTKIPAALENTFVSGRKNLIINGAMNVAQRATSVTGVATTAFRTCDRWLPSFNAMGTYTITQQAASGLSGFPSSQKFLCTTAASPATSNSFRLYYSMEGQDLQGIKKGYADAEAVTLSFWVKSNKTGTGQVNLSDNDNSRNVNKTYAISVADTWEKKTVTFPADTTGNLDNDNASSLSVMFFLDGGTNFTSGTVTETWHSATNANTGAGNTLAISGAVNNYFEITGVQLELGSVATDFEHRSYGEELALCQRYYYLHATKEGGAHPIGSAAFQSTNFADFNLHFPTTMRTKPTLEYVSGTDYYTVYANDQLDHFSGFTTRNTSPNAAQIYTNGGMGTGIAAGKAGIGYTRNDNAFMAFTAEL